jgi:hypothetical protein
LEIPIFRELQLCNCMPAATRFTRSDNHIYSLSSLICQCGSRARARSVYQPRGSTTHLALSLVFAIGEHVYAVADADPQLAEIAAIPAAILSIPIVDQRV